MIYWKLTPRRGKASSPKAPSHLVQVCLDFYSKEQQGTGSSLPWSWVLFSVDERIQSRQKPTADMEAVASSSEKSSALNANWDKFLCTKKLFLKRRKL